MSGDEPEELVVVYESSPMDAEIIRSLLEGDGIHAHVFQSGMAAYLGGSGPLSGGRLLVREEDRERALELIKAAKHGQLEVEGEPSPRRGWLYGILVAVIALGLILLILATGQDLY